MEIDGNKVLLLFRLYLAAFLPHIGFCSYKIFESGGPLNDNDFTNTLLPFAIWPGMLLSLIACDVWLIYTVQFITRVIKRNEIQPKLILTTRTDDDYYDVMTRFTIGFSCFIVSYMGYGWFYKTETISIKWLCAIEVLVSFLFSAIYESIRYSDKKKFRRVID